MTTSTLLVDLDELNTLEMLNPLDMHGMLNLHCSLTRKLWLSECGLTVVVQKSAYDPIPKPKIEQRQKQEYRGVNWIKAVRFFLGNKNYY